MPELSSADISSCIAVLKQFKPGFLPIEIFHQIARLVRLPTVDVIPLRTEGQTLQIGIIQREKNDAWWPGGWHLPGTIVRSTDTMESAIKRLLEKEILVKHCDPPLFRGFVLHQTKRGAELVLIHSIENCVLHHTSPTKWVPIDKLPDTFVESEQDAIEKLKLSLSVAAI